MWLRHWFPCEVDGSFEAGAELTFTFPQQRLSEQPMTISGTVREYDPPRLLVFSWGEDLLRFCFAKKDADLDEACARLRKL